MTKKYKVTRADNGYIFEQDGRLFVFDYVFSMVFSTLGPGEKVEITITKEDGKQD